MVGCEVSKKLHPGESHIITCPTKQTSLVAGVVDGGPWWELGYYNGSPTAKALRECRNFVVTVGLCRRGHQCRSGLPYPFTTIFHQNCHRIPLGYEDSLNTTSFNSTDSDDRDDDTRSYLRGVKK